MSPAISSVRPPWIVSTISVFALQWCIGAAPPLPVDHARRMARGIDSFQKDIAPLLKKDCLRCHGGEKTKDDLDMSTREDLLRGSHNGPVIVPFDAAKSLLVELINHAKEPNMPEDKPKLSADVIAKITAWINDGAPFSEPLIAGRKPKRDASVVTDEDRQWWAFRRFEISDFGFQIAPEKGAQMIDEMLLKKARGMSFNPPADRATLVRRMYLDLTGLPPEEKESSQFSVQSLSLLLNQV